MDSRKIHHRKHLLLTIAVLSIAALVPPCEATVNRKVAVQFVSYSNHEGRLADGTCCDGLTLPHGDCAPDNCDTTFSLCFKRSSSSADSQCLLAINISTIYNNNTVTSFGRRIGEMENDTFSLIALPFDTMENLTMEVAVLEVDHDVRHVLGNFPLQITWTDLFTLTPDWRQYHFENPVVSLVINVTSFCSKYFYGESCDTFCRPADSSYQGHYLCDNNGHKLCLSGRSCDVRDPAMTTAATTPLVRATADKTSPTPYVDTHITMTTPASSPLPSEDTTATAPSLAPESNPHLTPNNTPCPGIAQTENTPCRCAMETDSLEATLSQLSARLVQLEADNKDMRSELAETRAEHAAFRHLSPCSSHAAENRTAVAFHAWLKNSTCSTFGPVVPQEITTNVGDAFGQSGVFIAPVTGTYLFLITAGPNVDSGKPANLVLMIQREVGAVAVSSDLQNPDTSTNHAIVTLTRGDYVWLRAEGYAGFHGDHWTTFSGALLFES
ncbi:hypothetical protein BaRGS_00020259 [Batillaria attramentaria]|uniref:Delta-like protein n=1 Tax=Batillaria attramentaria TaxID=370345 RepID=A0ABD0KMM3_9CAEN